MFSCVFFFFNDTATTEIYTLSLHDALPIEAGRSTTVAALISVTTWLAPVAATVSCSWARGQTCRVGMETLLGALIAPLQHPERGRSARVHALSLPGPVASKPECEKPWAGGCESPARRLINPEPDRAAESQATPRARPGPCGPGYHLQRCRPRFAKIGRA